MPQGSAPTSYDALKRSSWAGRAQAYAETFAALCAHGVAPLLAATGAAAGHLVLDVGTGPGSVARAAAARGCRAVGVDADPQMLDLARTAGPGVEWVEAALPWPGPTFDVVLANFVVNHVGDPRAAVRELLRVTRPGGSVGVTVWPRPSSVLHGLWDDVVAAAGVSRPPAAQPLAPESDFTRTADGLAALLTECGWTDARAGDVPFTHVVDPEAWWSAVERGVATIGATYLAQDDEGRRAMRAAYDRLSRRFVGDDQLLHLPSSFVLASAVAPRSTGAGATG